MKTLNIIWLILLIISIGSCKEEPIGQYPVDDIAPGKVSNPVVEVLKGGATITYDLPEDKDLLYIKAEYTLANGNQKEVKSSTFSNSLTVLGFAKATTTQIKLISVDRSRNESEPLIVQIETLDSPIYDVYNGLDIIESFGGLKIEWQNPDETDIVIGVLQKNDEEKYVLLENFYTSVKDGLGAVRGLDPVETDFGIYIRDIYDNYTDTLFLTLTPWEETKLDKTLWRGLSLCPTFTLSKYGSTNMTCLWDDVTVTSDKTTMYYINNTSSEKIFFSFDLGVSAKLSRFKFWGRSSWYFNLHHPKEIEIYGTNDPNIANSDPCNWEGWELLQTCISTKPSGDDVLSNDNLTTEDKALAAAGEEFEFPLEVPVVRYIRFRTVRTWTDSKSSFLGELTFWGNVIE